jgi:anti-sigma B factor antagonist
MSTDSFPDVFADGPLSVAWNRYGNDVIAVSLAGELDRSNVASAHKVLAEVTDEGTGELLVVDLSGLEFIDSSGIALLVSLAELDRDALRVVPSPALAVSRVLRLTGVDSMLTMARERPTVARAA